MQRFTQTNNVFYSSVLRQIGVEYLHTIVLFSLPGRAIELAGYMFNLSLLGRVERLASTFIQSTLELLQLQYDIFYPPFDVSRSRSSYIESIMVNKLGKRKEEKGKIQVHTCI